MSDIAKRFEQNPILTPKDVKPSDPSLRVECLLNPGVFRYEGKINLLLRVAERPEQREGVISLPVLVDGKTEILEFDKEDPEVDDTDPRGIVYKGKCFLTTLSHFRLAGSDDGVHFSVSEHSIFGEGKHESFGVEDCRVTEIDGVFFFALYRCFRERSRHRNDQHGRLADFQASRGGDSACEQGWRAV